MKQLPLVKSRMSLGYPDGVIPVRPQLPFFVQNAYPPEMARRITTMEPELGELALEIVRWVEDYQPGIVACEFVDADP